MAWVAAIVPLALPVTGRADTPATPGPDQCLIFNNRVLGPRTQDRPLPLLRGDAEHGFSAACSVPWRVLNPGNEPLPVQGCFRASLLQLANDHACGPGTGRLWISSRWVVTSAELSQAKDQSVVCQQLETGAWAGTRAFSFECKPRAREFVATPSTGTTPAGAAQAPPPR